METTPRKFAIVRQEITEALKYKPIVDLACLRNNLGYLWPSIVAGIIHRESTWGFTLEPQGPKGTGDHGHGKGLMQIDDRWHEFARTGAWANPVCNINYGIELLAKNLNALATKKELISMDLLRAVIASYNCGLGNVRKAIKAGKDIDSFTTGGDYSVDVLARAAVFQNQGWS